jgi:hypothetical protein
VPELTFSSAREYIRKLGMTLVKTGYGDELRVRLLNSPPGHGYFTDDLEDAVKTAEAMYKHNKILRTGPLDHGRFVH